MQLGAALRLIPHPIVRFMCSETSLPMITIILRETLFGILVPTKSNTLAKAYPRIGPIKAPQKK
jgi:hypothetical protein